MVNCGLKGFFLQPDCPRVSSGHAMPRVPRMARKMPKHVEKPVIQVRERQMPVTTATVKEEMVEVPKAEATGDFDVSKVVSICVDLDLYRLHSIAIAIEWSIIIWSSIVCLFLCDFICLSIWYLYVYAISLGNGCFSEMAVRAAVRRWLSWSERRPWWRCRMWRNSWRESKSSALIRSADRRLGGRPWDQRWWILMKTRFLFSRKKNLV